MLPRAERLFRLRTQPTGFLTSQDFIYIMATKLCQATVLPVSSAVAQ